MMPKKSALFLMGGLAIFAIVLFSVARSPLPSTTAQTTSTLSLRVESARDEPNAPGGPVTRGDAVTQYKYLINVDNTGDPTQDRLPGCSPEDAGYPDTCDWPSIRAVPGAAPIFTQGNQDDFNGVLNAGINLPPGKYLVSILADGYKMGGAHFTVPLPDPDPVTGANVVAEIQPHPLPPATIRIKVFEDVSSVNGQFDAPVEQGLAGFRAIVNDIAGEISVDLFGNPLCTTYDAVGNITGQTDCLISDINGDIVIPNVGSNRYDVFVVPPDGEVWVETTTLEGSWSWDTWLQEGGTGLDNEFVVAGEPFPWTIFGFVRPTDLLNDQSVTGGVSGTIVSASVYLPQTGGLPYYGDIWNGFNGSKVTGPIDNAWVALSDFQNGDTAVYVGPANEDGSFQIDNVPDGNYLFTWWDYDLHYILDWIQVTVTDGQIYDMGTPFLTGWFTKVDGYVFNDQNKNGQKDPGEPGLANYLVVLRDRDNSEIDRMTIAVTTDPTGYYVFDKVYPMTSWMVLEAYNDRFYTTGITFQVENQVDPNTGQPTSYYNNQSGPTTIVGDGVDVGILPVLGQSARLDWGVHPYEAGTNGGIVGSVFYDTTRNELDPRYQAAEPWSPGIPDINLNLYEPVHCTDPLTQSCDARGDYQLNPDGSYMRGPLLNTTTTEAWTQPTDCVARDPNGNALLNPQDQQVLPHDPQTGKRCLEGPLVGTQIESGFATLDGNWGFTEGCFGPGGALSEGVCADGTAPVSLPGEDYLVEVAIPNDSLGRPLYQVVREEDINVYGGDQFVPQVPPPACAGALHTVDVAGILPDGPNAVINPSFADVGGSPFEGAQKPLCDIKLVTLANGKSVAPIFTLFTEVPIAGKWKGYIIDDLTVSTNPIDLSYGEKAGMPNAPIGIYDFNNNLVTTIESDPNGVFEVLLPSTHSVNCPTPSGVCPNVYYMLGNDPGQPGQLNANYSPQYRTIGASFEIYPGLIVPSDLAPTQIVPGVLAAGSLFSAPPQCTLNDPLNPVTPEIFAVSKPYHEVALGDGAITIQGQGFGLPGAGSKALLNGVTSLPITGWTDTQIDVTLPAATPPGAYQLSITADNGNHTVNGLTFHVLGAGYNPVVYEVGPTYAYATIQSAIDAASTNDPGNALVVVYPDAPAQWNPAGLYYENVVLYAPIKLQGIGPGGIYPDNTAVLGSVIDGRGVAGDTGYAAAWLAFVTSLTWDGPQAIYEGPVVYVLAEDGEFTNTFPATVDGFIIQGGDQQGFPNQLNPVDPTQKDVAAVQGGGIFANAYANYLQITNNILQSNGGAYASAIRMGTPHLPGAMNDNQNDFVRIANNRILANGGTNLAGGVGIFSGTEGYEIAYNDICGNFSAEYGGGISHYGFSPGGQIHHNRIYFNRSYDEGGGIMIAGELPADFTTLSPGSGPVDIYANLIQANLGNDDGGGLRFLMSGDFPFNVYNNIIVNNISTHEGGGVSLSDAPDVRFYNNTVMKNITTATAMTSNGSPAPAGLSSSRNSTTLQNTLPPGSPIFSDPLLFNNIFWDNRAGAYTGGTVVGIGLAGDPNPINNWDLGVADGTGLLAPTNSMLQVTAGTIPDGSNIVGLDPLVGSLYDTSVRVLPWRGNPRFVDILIVTADATPNLLGNYHLQPTSPAFDAGAVSKGVINAPFDDIDGDLRPADNGYEMGADEIGSAAPASQMYFSTVGGNVIPGVGGTNDDADIYNWDGAAFGRVFDASVEGLPGHADIDGLVIVSPTQFYISFNRNDGTIVPGLGIVEDEDVVFYDAGVWTLYFDGSAHGLVEDSQDLDAIDIVGNVLYFSTSANSVIAGVPGMVDDADIISWDGANFSLVFDASAEGLPGNADIDGLDMVLATTFYMTFNRNGGVTVPGGVGIVQDEDVVLYDAGAWSLYFDGAAHGLNVADGQDLDALALP